MYFLFITDLPKTVRLGEKTFKIKEGIPYSEAIQM